jgi:cyanate permease
MVVMEMLVRMASRFSSLILGLIMIDEAISVSDVLLVVVVKRVIV